MAVSALLRRRAGARASEARMWWEPTSEPTPPRLFLASPPSLSFRLLATKFFPRPSRHSLLLLYSESNPPLSTSHRRLPPLAELLPRLPRHPVADPRAPSSTSNSLRYTVPPHAPTLRLPTSRGARSSPLEHSGPRVDFARMEQNARSRRRGKGFGATLEGVWAFPCGARQGASSGSRRRALDGTCSRFESGGGTGAGADA